MTYSCVDFVDTILDVLNVRVPMEDWDDPGAQAVLALAEINKHTRALSLIQRFAQKQCDANSDEAILWAQVVSFANEGLAKPPYILPVEDEDEDGDA